MSQQHRIQLADADSLARREAQREFSQPMVVQAGAGTGKTCILVARMITWCLGPGWEREAGDDADPQTTAAAVAQGMVAMTFTEAAAAEMAERLATGLMNIATGETPIGVDSSCLPPSDQAVERAKALGAELFRVRVRTIHSLCNSLLQTYPVEARLDPGFTVDESGLEAEAEALNVADEATRLALGEAPDPRWLRLAANGIGPRKLAAAVTELVRRGATTSTINDDPFDSHSTGELMAVLEARLTAFASVDQGRLATATRAGVAVATSAQLSLLMNAVAAIHQVDGDSLATLVDLIDDKMVLRLKKWAGGSFAKAEASALDGRETELQAAAAELAPLLKAMGKIRVRELRDASNVVGELLQTTITRLRTRGITTFDALLLETRNLLRDHQWLRREVRGGISQLLVDEFQDTDAVQCDIIRYLALDGKAEERPGLFIVGDPKQSIYGWRNADLRAYEDFVERLQDAGGVMHRLSVNYRSSPAILNEVERVVSRIMIAEGGLQPPFEPLLPCPAKEHDPGMDLPPWAPVEHWVTWPEEVVSGSGSGTTNQALALEATALARDLAALHRHAEVPYREMAVLLRATTELDTILEALREAGVPYTVARDREYYKRREVSEAAALARVIIDPTDQLALVTLLRSDIVGVPDAALVPLFQEGLTTTMLSDDVTACAEAIDRAVAEMPAWVPDLHRLPHWPDALKAAVEATIDLRESFAKDPPDTFCEKLRSLLASEATAAARYLGHYRRARLDRFFAELEKQLVEGRGGRAGLSRFLRRAVDEGYECTETSPAAQVREAVQVMTMHKAKGLDFEHVYVLQLQRGSGGGFGSPPAEILSWADSSAVRLFGWPSPGAILADEWGNRVEAAEMIRLLYVAMTRARSRLVLGGAWPGGMDIKARGGTRFVDLVADEDTIAALVDQKEAGIERRQEGQVQWVLPALTEPISSVQQETQPTLGPSSDAVIQEAALLQGRRLVAQARNQRPWSRGASSGAHAGSHEIGEQLEQEEPVVRPKAASAIGTMLHKLLEDLGLGKPLAPQVAERRAELEAALAEELNPADLEAAGARLESLLSQLEHGRCLLRLEQLSDHIIARELAVLAPPTGTNDAVGYLIGRVDLVYSDPATGELVVADFKTDAVARGDEAQQRAEGYRSQLEVYCTAITKGLELDTPPRAELWFLAADEIVELESER